MSTSERIVFDPQDKKRHVDAFLDEAKHWLGPSIRKITSYLAIKQDGEWSLLFAHVRCDSVMTTAPAAKSFESDRILAGRHIELLSGVDWETALADEIYCGRIVLPFGAIALQKGDRWNPYRLQYGDAIVDNVTPRVCGFRLHGKQFTRIEPYVFNDADINWEMKGAKTPYYDFNDLLNDFGMANMRTQSESSYIEINVFPPSVMSRESAIRGDVLAITLAAQQEIDVSAVSLGLLSHGKSVDRTLVESAAISWKEGDGNMIGTVTRTIDGIVFAQVFLRYRGQAVDQMMLINPDRSFNPAAELYKLIDPGHENLVKYLSGEGENRAPQLEAGVAVLFHLHGFRVLHLGKKIHYAGDASDLMAIAPDGSTLMVECTTGLINAGGKLGKLHARVEQAKNALQGANMDYVNVLGVIVTSRRREEVQGDIAEAGRLGIAVACRADIDLAVAEISTVPRPDIAYRRLTALVPEHVPASNAGGYLGSG